MPRKALPGFGVKGAMGRRGALVRGFVEPVRGRVLVRVQWREAGRRLTASWTDTPEGRAHAVAFGRGVVDRLEALASGGVVAPVRAPQTVRAVWDAYRTAKWDDLRMTTQKNYTEAWDAFELFVGRHKLADAITRETLDAFRQALRAKPTSRGKKRSVAQVRRTVEKVMQVLRWAIDRDLVTTETKLLAYRQSNSRHERAQAAKPDEYTRAEVAALLDGLAMAPRDVVDWRVYVLITLFAFTGGRQRAVRSLTWADVDFDGGRVHWRAETDKMATDRWQPVPAVVLEALHVAYGWRTAADYRGPYVLFRPGMGRTKLEPKRVQLVYPSRTAAARADALATAGKDRPYTYGAFWSKLRALEAAVGVERKPLRAAHSLRRHVVTELLARTGNLVLAGRYVGDVDVRTLTRSYVRDREEDLAAAGALLDDFDRAEGAG